MSPRTTVEWMVAGLVMAFIGWSAVHLMVGPANGAECKNISKHVDEFKETFDNKPYGLKMHLRQAEDKGWVVYVTRSDVSDRLMLIFFHENQCPHPIHPNGQNWVFSSPTEQLQEHIKGSELIYSNPAALGKPDPASVEKI